MKIKFLKDCLIPCGVQKANTVLELDDAFATRLNSAGITQTYVEPDPEGDGDDSEQTQQQAKALQPEETKPALQADIETKGE